MPILFEPGRPKPVEGSPIEANPVIGKIVKTSTGISANAKLIPPSSCVVLNQNGLNGAAFSSAISTGNFLIRADDLLVLEATLFANASEQVFIAITFPPATCFRSYTGHFDLYGHGSSAGGAPVDSEFRAARLDWR